jgi:hypothetical protein
VIVAVSWAVQGQVAAMRGRSRQPLRSTRPAVVNKRSRARLGSHMIVASIIHRISDPSPPGARSPASAQAAAGAAARGASGAKR